MGTDNQSLEQALIDFGLALTLQEDPALAATEPDDSFLLQKAVDWFASRKEDVRSILCSNQRPRPGIKLTTTIAIAAALKLSGHFGEHFPAQAAANAIMTFGLEKFCAGDFPA